ncbi:signal peptidase I [Clostridium botulinum]|nr:signal peptidase I [Clostridium botulinum]
MTLLKLKKISKNLVYTVLIAIIIALVAIQFLFFKTKVPTPSMDPTIKVGDNIFVTRIYNFNNIKRGDILVFNSSELKERLIKRVIGLPGETVKVKNDGTVLINDKELQEPYVKHPGGKSGIFKVPEGEYFFMGDNRADSNDGRYWNYSYIPAKDINGKAQIIVFPFSRVSFLK